MADDKIQIVEAGPTEVVSAEEQKRRALENMERAVVARNVEVFSDAAFFTDIDPEDPSRIPDEWWDEPGMTLVKATRRLRTAQYALMNAKEAPVGLQMAKAIVTANVKARAAAVNIGQLNVAKVMMIGNLPQYEEKEVE